VTLPHPDTTQFNNASLYFDAKSSKTAPRWWCVDVAYVSMFPRLVSLEDLKGEKAFADSRLTQKGNRLSIVPLTKAQYDSVLRLSQEK